MSFINIQQNEFVITLENFNKIIEKLKPEQKVRKVIIKSTGLTSKAVPLKVKKGKNAIELLDFLYDCFPNMNEIIFENCFLPDGFNLFVESLNNKFEKNIKIGFKECLSQSNLSVNDIIKNSKNPNITIQNTISPSTNLIVEEFKDAFGASNKPLTGARTKEQEWKNGIETLEKVYPNVYEAGKELLKEYSKKKREPQYLQELPNIEKKLNAIYKLCLFSFRDMDKIFKSHEDIKKHYDNMIKICNKMLTGRDDEKKKIVHHILYSWNQGKKVNFLFHGAPGVGKTSFFKLVSALTCYLFNQCRKISPEEEKDGIDYKSIDYAIEMGVHNFSYFNMASKDENYLLSIQSYYVNSHPGALIQALTKPFMKYPVDQYAPAVLCLDELDKASAKNSVDDKKTNITSVLCTALEESTAMRVEDAFIGIPIDMTHAYFVFCVNDITKLPSYFRDRCTEIYFSAYSRKDKFRIIINSFLEKWIKSNAAGYPLSYEVDYKTKEIHIYEEINKEKKLIITIKFEAIFRLIELLSIDPGIRSLKRILEEYVVPGILQYYFNSENFILIDSNNILNFIPKDVLLSNLDEDPFSKPQLAKSVYVTDQGRMEIKVGRIESRTSNELVKLVSNNNNIFKRLDFVQKGLNDYINSVFQSICSQCLSIAAPVKNFLKQNCITVAVNFDKDIEDKDLFLFYTNVAFAILSAILGRKIDNTKFFSGIIDITGKPSNDSCLNMNNILINMFNTNHSIKTVLFPPINPSNSSAKKANAETVYNSSENEVDIVYLEDNNNSLENLIDQLLLKKESQAPTI